MQLWSVKCLLYARYCAKWFTYTISFNVHNNPICGNYHYHLLDEETGAQKKLNHKSNTPSKWRHLWPFFCIAFILDNRKLLYYDCFMTKWLGTKSEEGPVIYCSLCFIEFVWAVTMPILPIQAGSKYQTW